MTRINKVLLLRVVHGFFAIYFLACLLYLYYASIFSKLNSFLLVAVISLSLEGFMVFVLNSGDCPLIHIQRRIGDNTPFFNLFLPPKIAKQTVPALAKISWFGFGLLAVRLILRFS